MSYSDTTKIFIFGSCVSRDFLEISGTRKFSLENYYARSSLASISSEPLRDDRLVRRIESKWQRSMVKRDLGKNVIDDIINSEFDIFLIDLIDERFNLAECNSKYCTISTEYKKYQVKGKYKTIPFDSDKKIELWKKGFEKLFKVLEEKGAVDKIRISRVYWAENDERGESFPDSVLSYIKKNNNMLEKMYSHMSKFININQFIDYPKYLLVSSSTHKWGLQPFHYIDDFYHYTNNSLSLAIKTRCASEKKGAAKVYSDLISAYNSIKEGEFFINKDGVMYPFKWNVRAGSEAPIVFFTPGRTRRGKLMPVFQRSKYFDDLGQYNCVSCFDPTLFKDEDINLAWFQGERRRFYALELAKLWRDFVVKFKFDSRKILYFGTSGGGIPGFHLAKATPGSTLFVSNIQTDIRVYDKRTLDKLSEVAFSGDEEYIKNAGETQNRFSVNGVSGAFRLIYAQNKVDEFHLEKHYKKWRALTDLKAFESVDFIEYYHSESGHGPLPKETEIEIIHRIIRNEDYKPLFPGVGGYDEKYNSNDAHIKIEIKNHPDLMVSNFIPWDINPFKSKSWCIKYYGLTWLIDFVNDGSFERIINSIAFRLKRSTYNKVYARFEREVFDRQVDSIFNVLGALDKKEREGGKAYSSIIELIDILSLNAKGLRFDAFQINSRLLSQNKRIKKIVEYLKDENLLAIFNKQVREDGFIKCPSLFGESDAVCSSSLYFKNRNILIFKDLVYGCMFLLVQDFTRSFPFLIIDLLRKKVYSNAPRDTKALKISEGLPLSKIVHEKIEFGGYINAYARPYHYFLEKAPFFKPILSEYFETKVITVSKSSFLLLSDVYGDKNISEKVVESQREIESLGFYIDVFRSSSSERNSLLIDEFKSRCIQASCKYKSYDDFFSDSEFTVWLGICSEKRVYLEQKELHKKILSYLNSKFGRRYCVIFDGITALVSDDKIQTKSSEEEYVEFISKYTDGRVIKTSGASALEKISLSRRTDVFVSNALTDSIWTSWFLNKKGVAFSAKGSKILFPHENTCLVEEDKIFNIDESNWSTTSFSIDPCYVYDCFLNVSGFEK